MCSSLRHSIGISGKESNFVTSFSHVIVLHWTITSYHSTWNNNQFLINFPLHFGGLQYSFKLINSGRVTVRLWSVGGDLRVVRIFPWCFIWLYPVYRGVPPLIPPYHLSLDLPHVMFPYSITKIWITWLAMYPERCFSSHLT